MTTDGQGLEGEARFEGTAMFGRGGREGDGEAKELERSVRRSIFITASIRQ
jgi:hypothetical protein